MHQVYNMVPTAATGGHFYNFDILHQSEAALFYTHRRRELDTNFHHRSTSHTLMLMLNSLKDQGPRSE